MIFEWLLKVILISGIAFAGFFAFMLILQPTFAENSANIVAAILTFFGTMFTAVLGANAMYSQLEKRGNGYPPGNPNGRKNGGGNGS